MLSLKTGTALAAIIILKQKQTKFYNDDLCSLIGAVLVMMICVQWIDKVFTQAKLECRYLFLHVLTIKTVWNTPPPPPKNYTILRIIYQRYSS